MNKIDFLKTIPDPQGNGIRSHLFTYNGKIGATEGHILFLTNIPDDFKDEVSDGTEKIAQVYTPPSEPFVKYSVQSILGEYNKLPLVDEIDYEDCKECDGYGSVEYNYEAKDGTNHEISGDCPECNGRGSWDKKTGNKIADTDNFHFKFGECVFNPNMVMKILNSPECPEIIDLYPKNNRLYFRTGEFDGILMGLSIDMLPGSIILIKPI